MILAATLCLAAVSPALGITAETTYEYDWVQTSGSPGFTGYLLLNASSGTDVAASTAIVNWNISGGSQPYTGGDSFIFDSAALLTWGSSITSISPTLQIQLDDNTFSLLIAPGSISEKTLARPTVSGAAGSFILNGSTVPDAFNTAVLLGIGLVGLAGFNLNFRRARRSRFAQPKQ